MPKKITEEDYRIAMSIYKNEFDELDPHEDDLLPAKMLSAEKQVMKQQAWERLSEESKEVVDVILHSPKEVVNLMSTPHRRAVTIRSIHRHLSKVFHSKFVARHIIKEIKEWVKHF